MLNSITSALSRSVYASDVNDRLPMPPTRWERLIILFAFILLFLTILELQFKAICLCRSALAGLTFIWPQFIVGRCIRYAFVGLFLNVQPTASDLNADGENFGVAAMKAFSAAMIAVAAYFIGKNKKD